MSASVVIGQTDFTHGSTNQGGGVAANTLFQPNSNVTDGTKLMIPDYGNNRMLIFNKIPSSNNASADIVIGQPNFTSNSANQGGSAAANTLRNPAGSFTDGKRLFISDLSNNRVLLFNSIPTSNNASADVVIGQPDFTTTNSVISRNGGFNNPDGIFLDPQTGKLFVTDRGNNRVLIYNQIPTTNGAPADVVLGQPDFTSSTANNGGVSASSFFAPARTLVVNGKLIIVDINNNRVLIWNSIPTTNDAAANVVIGQPNFTSNSANQGFSSPRANTFHVPGTLGYDGKRLYISDTSNNRILIFNSIPTSNNTSADVVIGQPNFTSNSANQGATSPNSNTFSTVNGTTIINNQLVASDFNNNRVLIFNNSPQTPTVIFSGVSGGNNGLTRLFGTAMTGSPYTITSVSYGVNGSSFSGATATDGSFDEQNENFFFDFNPTSNGNNQPGYVAEAQVTNNNTDTSPTALYFQPFVLNSPGNNTATTQQFPTFMFSVNTQEAILKNDLSHYRIMLQKNGENRITYVDNIPVDYASVQNSSQNLQPSNLSTNGNGTYEDANISVNYSNNNSTITVRSKTATPLDSGTYNWRVEAVDKAGNAQTTDTWTFFFGSTVPNSSGFPLQLDSITGVHMSLISTINPSAVQSFYTTTSSHPTFFGDAAIGSMVTLKLTDQLCSKLPTALQTTSCTQTFTTTANANSQFGINTPFRTLLAGRDYTVLLFATFGSEYAQLPTFTLRLESGTVTPTPMGTTETIPPTETPSPFPVATNTPETTVPAVAPASTIGNASRWQSVIAAAQTLWHTLGLVLVHFTPVVHILFPIVLLGLLPLVSFATLLINLTQVQFSWNLLVRSLQALGLLPRGTLQGIVYDTKTNNPVAFALLTLVGVNGVRETLVSDAYGVYPSITLPEGIYQLTAAHSDYRFPTEKPRPPYLTVQEFYKGEDFTRDSKKPTFFFIPVDALTSEQRTRIARQTFMRRILFVVGKIASFLFWPFALLSILLFALQMTVANGLLLTFYGLAVLFKLLLLLKRPTLTGAVTDTSNHPLRNATIRLIDPKTNNTVAVTQTNSKGIYAFYAPKKIYQIIITKDGYNNPQDTLSQVQVDTRKMKKQITKLTKITLSGLSLQPQQFGTLRV